MTELEKQLMKEVAELSITVSVMAAKIQDLELVIKELKEQNNKNSHNSSKPLAKPSPKSL